jgi:hypothetical protein
VLLCGRAAAGGAPNPHADGLALGELDAEVVDDLEGPEAQAHLLHGQDGHGQLAAIGSSVPAAGICVVVLLLTMTSS